MYRFWLSSSSFSCRDLRAATAFFPCLFRDGPNPSELRRERANAASQALINVSSSGIVSAASLSANAIEATMSQRTCAWDKYSPALEAKSFIYIFRIKYQTPADKRNIVVIDLNRINNLSYDDKLFEISIDGMMVEKIVNTSTDIHKINITEMVDSNIKINDYFTPSLYEVLKSKIN